MEKNAGTTLQSNPRPELQKLNLPKISVITPSFNSATTIRDTIESVREQNYSHFEHIIVDGGSTDGTLDILKSYPHLLWVSESDEGHYHAMNKGVQRSTGDVVTILNADDFYLPGVLAKVGDAFARNPDWDGLFGDIIYVDSNKQEIYRRQEAVYDYDVLRFSGCCYVIHQTLFLHKAVHDKIGLYRYKEYLNCCDYDLILELGKAGCRIGHLPEYVVNYRYHDHGQSADLRVTNNMARESLLIRQKHGFPGGIRGQILRSLFRLKRQFQKFRYLGKCDLVPGTWHLRKHMKEKTNFSSRIESQLQSRA